MSIHYLELISNHEPEPSGCEFFRRTAGVIRIVINARS
jgi:hypothetical protein